VRKTDDNPQGVDGQVFEGIKGGDRTGPLAFLGTSRQLNNVEVSARPQSPPKPGKPCQRRGGIITV